MSATAALQLLRDDGHIQAGQKVLINGASGGVGTFAVQIAKAFGAEVTGVCSTKNTELVRSIGADHVIDYTKADFRTGEQRYDLILDNVGDHSMSATRRALAPNGTLLSNGGAHAGGKLARVIRHTIVSMFVRQQGKPSIKSQNRADLLALKELVEAGKVTPVIDATYPLAETREAMGHVGAGHARGTVVIAIAAAQVRLIRRRDRRRSRHERHASQATEPGGVRRPRRRDRRRDRDRHRQRRRWHRRGRRHRRCHRSQVAGIAGRLGAQPTLCAALDEPVHPNGGPSMNVVEVSELRKQYGSHVAVDGVSFAVEEGEIFGILGPNGAGKTTTVETIAGLRKPDGGTIRVLRPRPAAGS